MNKAILVLTLIFSSLIINAQNLTVQYPQLTQEGPLVTYEASFYSNIYNNSNDTLDLQWVRIENNLPQGWASKVCDDGLCYDETVSTANYIERLAPGDSTYIVGYVVVDGVTQGDADVTIVIFDMNDSINKNATFNFQYSTWPTGIQQPDKSVINIYPVPAKDILNIELSAKVASAEIYDITGRNLISRNFYQNKKDIINISNLNSGNYIIRLKDEAGATIDTKSFVKQ